MEPRTSFLQFPHPDRARCWWERIQAWRASGLTQAKFCEQEGLYSRTMSRWKTRLCDFRVSPAVESQDLNGQSGESIEFIPVQVVGREPPRHGAGGSGAPWFEIVLANERKVRVPPDFDRDSLRRLLDTLETQ